LNPTPLIAIVVSITSLYIAVSLYRALYPYEDVRRALEIASEYRSLTAYIRSKRVARKAKSREPEYRRARSLILRTILVKFLLITLSYVSVALALTAIMPVVETPYYIPLITFKFEDCPVGGVRGECILMPMLYLHFITFIYAMLLFRELML
jgi:hypothetical protein